MTLLKTLAALGFFPNARDRQAVGADKLPYWHVLNYTLASRASGDGKILPVQNFILLSLMGSGNQAGLNFRTQFLQVVNETEALRTSRQGVNFNNMLGSGRQQFILRRPYHAPNRQPILNRSINMQTATNTIQIVLFGLQDREEKAAPQP